MKQARDSKRNNTYNIENAFWNHPNHFQGNTPVTIQQAQELVDSIVATYDMKPITVVQGEKGNISFWRLSDRTISILPSMMKEWIVIHEVAHALTDHRLYEVIRNAKEATGNQEEINWYTQSQIKGMVAGHGPAFLSTYIELVKVHFGEVFATAFQNTWELNNRKPSTVVEEIKQSIKANDKKVVRQVKDWLINHPAKDKNDPHTNVYIREVSFRDCDRGITINGTNFADIPDSYSHFSFKTFYDTLGACKGNEVLVTDFKSSGNIISFTAHANEKSFDRDSYSPCDYLISENPEFEIVIDLDKVCCSFQVETHSGSQRYSDAETVVASGNKWTDSQQLLEILQMI